jgi:hypothetical protein
MPAPWFTGQLMCLNPVYGNLQLLKADLYCLLAFLFLFTPQFLIPSLFSFIYSLFINGYLIIWPLVASSLP